MDAGQIPTRWHKAGMFWCKSIHTELETVMHKPLTQEQHNAPPCSTLSANGKEEEEVISPKNLSYTTSSNPADVIIDAYDEDSVQFHRQFEDVDDKTQIQLYKKVYGSVLNNNLLVHDQINKSVRDKPKKIISPCKNNIEDGKLHLQQTQEKQINSCVPSKVFSLESKQILKEMNVLKHPNQTQHGRKNKCDNVKNEIIHSHGTESTVPKEYRKDDTVKHQVYSHHAKHHELANSRRPYQYHGPLITFQSQKILPAGDDIPTTSSPTQPPPTQRINDSEKSRILLSDPMTPDTTSPACVCENIKNEAIHNHPQYSPHDVILFPQIPGPDLLLKRIPASPHDVIHPTSQPSQTQSPPVPRRARRHVIFMAAVLGLVTAAAITVLLLTTGHGDHDPTPSTETQRPSYDVLKVGVTFSPENTTVTSLSLTPEILYRMQRLLTIQIDDMFLRSNLSSVYCCNTIVTSRDQPSVTASITLLDDVRSTTSTYDVFNVLESLLVVTSGRHGNQEMAELPPCAACVTMEHERLAQKPKIMLYNLDIT